MLRFEALDFFTSQISLDQLFNFLKLYHLISANQGARAALFPCATCSSNAVYVILSNIGQVKVHHHR